MTFSTQRQADFFWSHIEYTDSCWEWQAATNRWGYGISTNGLAHRVAYRELVGPIPERLVLDHLCRNTLCVNPDHLEPVTHRENVVRGDLPEVTRRRHAERAHCPKGHAYEGENLYVDKRGARRCRTCHRDRAREWKRRNTQRYLST